MHKKRVLGLNATAAPAAAVARYHVVNSALQRIHLQKHNSMEPVGTAGSTPYQCRTTAAVQPQNPSVQTPDASAAVATDVATAIAKPISNAAKQQLVTHSQCFCNIVTAGCSLVAALQRNHYCHCCSNLVQNFYLGFRA